MLTITMTKILTLALTPKELPKVRQEVFFISLPCQVSQVTEEALSLPLFIGE